MSNRWIYVISHVPLVSMANMGHLSICSSCFLTCSLVDKKMSHLWSENCLRLSLCDLCVLQKRPVCASIIGALHIL